MLPCASLHRCSCIRPQPNFFFLMTRPPPRSTPFPTRRSSDLAQPPSVAVRRAGEAHAQRAAVGAQSAVALDVRSEEHTSELQSRFDLVCRLLLEKKKNNIKLPGTAVSSSDDRAAASSPCRCRL